MKSEKTDTSNEEVHKITEGVRRLERSFDVMRADCMTWSTITVPRAFSLLCCTYRNLTHRDNLRCCLRHDHGSPCE